MAMNPNSTSVIIDLNIAISSLVFLIGAMFILEIVFAIALIHYMMKLNKSIKEYADQNGENTND